MKAFLDIVAGPHTGYSIPLTAGVLRFGRESASEYVLNGDHFLSDVHFAVGARADSWGVKDLGSLNGTSVNGVRIAQAGLQDGDRISAGRSAFGLRVADAAEGSLVLPQPGPIPPRQGWTGPHASAQLTPAQCRAMDILSTQAGTMFAVLDAARDKLVLPFMESQADPYRCLFEGKAAEDYSPVAPYLVSLSAAGCEKLLQLSWGLSWGIFVHSPMPMESLRRHLRKFLIAETPDEKRVLFRFYDPRVLRVYLPTCSAGEAAAFLGSNCSFVMEDQRRGRWVCFERGSRGLKIDYALLEHERTI